MSPPRLSKQPKREHKTPREIQDQQNLTRSMHSFSNPELPRSNADQLEHALSEARKYLLLSEELLRQGRSPAKIEPPRVPTKKPESRLSRN